jgi:CubicO group peptidase (beta-lactamase class C family)
MISRRSISCIAIAFLASLSLGNAAEKEVTADSLAAVVAQRAADAETPACVAVGYVADVTQFTFACGEGAGPANFTRRSIFEIGSITKGFTGLLLADMVRKGEVSLDDPASKHSRPEAKLPKWEGREITLRDLVTHTASLPRMPPGFAPKNPRDPFADFDADALYAALERTELTGEIGKTNLYSNFGFMWLSEMLARRAGKPYDVALAERVLGPLGMTDTMLVPSADQAARIVIGHDTSYRAAPAWNNARDLAGVGGLRSSMDDMVKLAGALAGRRDTPLAETIALALAPMRPAFGRNSIGYAWLVHERDDIRIYWHNGGTGGFRSMIAVNPAAKTAVVVLVDSATSFDDLALHLAGDDAVPLVKKRVSLPLDAAARDEYAGSYELAPTFAIRVFAQGEKLIAQATGQGPLELGREGPDAFFTRGVAARIVFRRDAAGKVDGLTLHQGGRETFGKRVP